MLPVYHRKFTTPRKWCGVQIAFREEKWSLYYLAVLFSIRLVIGFSFTQRVPFNVNIFCFKVSADSEV